MDESPVTTSRVDDSVMMLEALPPGKSDRYLKVIGQRFQGRGVALLIP